MTNKICACCGQPFEPRPQVPDQAYCSSPNCQRARKRQWQRAKLQSDSDYRINQRAAQQEWSQRNQEYWRDYRDARPEYAQRNRDQQRAGSVAEIAEAEGMDVTQVRRVMRLTLLAPEVVERLAGSPDAVLEKVMRRPWPNVWGDQMRVLALPV